MPPGGSYALEDFMARLMYDASNPANIPNWDSMVMGYQHGWAGWLSPYMLVTRRPLLASRLILIDNTGKSPTEADVIDSETGAATVDDVHTWCGTRHDIGWWSCAYCDVANLADVRAAAKGTNTDFGIANWNLTRAEAEAQLGGDIVFVQYESPTSAKLPGYDISVVDDSWFAAPKPAPVAASLLSYVHELVQAAGAVDTTAHEVLAALTAPAS